jgi:hypothetical protein
MLVINKYKYAPAKGINGIYDSITRRVTFQLGKRIINAQKGKTKRLATLNNCVMFIDLIACYW